MPRTARNKSESGFYHIIHSGAGGQDIFMDDADMLFFTDTLKRYVNELSFEIHAYCLMKNHVHLLLNDPDKQLGRIMKKISCRYAYYFNTKYGRTGSLFQNRFKSEPIEDDVNFLKVLRYIHHNPMQAGITRGAEYRRSSHGEYLNGGCLTVTYLALRLLDGIGAYTDFMDGDEIYGCLDMNCITKGGIDMTKSRETEIIQRAKLANKILNDRAKRIRDTYSGVAGEEKAQTFISESGSRIETGYGKQCQCFTNKYYAVALLDRLPDVITSDVKDTGKILDAIHIWRSNNKSPVCYKVNLTEIKERIRECKKDKTAVVKEWEGGRLYTFEYGNHTYNAQFLLDCAAILGGDVSLYQNENDASSASLMSSSNGNEAIISSVNCTYRMVVRARNELKKDDSIENVEFSVRAYNALKRANINTVSDLMNKSEEDLLKMRNVGRKTLDEIINKIAEF